MKLSIMKLYAGLKIALFPHFVYTFFYRAIHMSLFMSGDRQPFYVSFMFLAFERNVNGREIEKGS